MKEPIETPEPIKPPRKYPKPLSGQMVAGIKASLELGNSIRKIRKETGHAIGTIMKIKHGEIEVNPEMVERIKRNFSNKLWTLSGMELDSLLRTASDDKVMDKIPYGTRKLALCQGIDKGLLLDGKATSITEIRDSTMDELMNQLGNILRRSPQIGIEITRMIATMPEGVREPAMRCLPGSKVADGSGQE
jgi:hypothetical protein